jgi:hypothetical protein
VKKVQKNSVNSVQHTPSSESFQVNHSLPDYRNNWRGRVEGKNEAECLITHHDTKTYGGVELQLHAFLISAVDRGD